MAAKAKRKYEAYTWDIYSMRLHAAIDDTIENGEFKLFFNSNVKNK